MKTIKQTERQLEANRIEKVEWALRARLLALKDVLVLIDDLERRHGKHWFIKELKDEITGETK